MRSTLFFLSKYSDSFLNINNNNINSNKYSSISLPCSFAYSFINDLLNNLEFFKRDNSIDENFLTISYYEISENKIIDLFDFNSYEIDTFGNKIKTGKTNLKIFECEDITSIEPLIEAQIKKLEHFNSLMK